MSKPDSHNPLADYDYDLPEQLIARTPLAERDGSRMLVVDRARGAVSSHSVRELPNWLSDGDCLVVNDTRVLPARLYGVRTTTGGRWEGLYLGLSSAGHWQLIGQTRGTLQPLETIALTPAHPDHAAPASSLSLQLLSQGDGGVWDARPQPTCDPLEALEAYGTMPLPPYIQRDVATPEDVLRYQTVYAEHPGAVAAPTAGLHLSENLLQDCQEAGIGLQQVTLHVGLGTFRPIASETLDQHQMHSEWCRLTSDTAQELDEVRRRGRRTVAVGTTVVRTLESAASQVGLGAPYEGSTDLFIRPGHKFQAIDALLTNFHLPKSTLFVLVCAFCGTDLARAAYRHAISNHYRFYSYGDCMLIL